MDPAEVRQHAILETVASARDIAATARRCGMAVDSVEQVFDAARGGGAVAERAAAAIIACSAPA